MHHPALPVLRAYLVRGVLLWVGVRATLAVLALLSGGSEAVRGSIVGGPAGAPAAIPLTVLLSLVDAQWWGQRVLLANLGVSIRALAALVTVAAGLGELALAFAVALAPHA